MQHSSAPQTLIAGGRSLTAIWRSSLSTNEKIVLLYIASEMNFTGLKAMMQPRWIPVGRIMAATSLSRATVFTVIRRLEHTGYLSRGQRYQDNMQLPNAYSLAPRVFEEHAERLRRRAEQDSSGARAGNSLATELKGLGSRPIHRDVAPELVYEPDTELPQEAPSKLPQISPGLQRQLEREAFAIGALIYMPSGNAHQRYVDRDALRARMCDALAEFGIGVLRRLKDRVVAEGMLGQVTWDPHRLFDYCRAAQQVDA